MLTNFKIETSPDVTNEQVVMTLKAEIDRKALAAYTAALGLSGNDGLGDPTTSKGLQQVVYQDGSYAFLSYSAAVEQSKTHPDFVTMIDVAALRARLRTVLN